jgi:hypothetical protein
MDDLIGRQAGLKIYGFSGQPIKIYHLGKQGL